MLIPVLQTGKLSPRPAKALLLKLGYLKSVKYQPISRLSWLLPGQAMGKRQAGISSALLPPPVPVVGKDESPHMTWWPLQMS